MWYHPSSGAQFLRYELLPVTIARLERCAAEEMICKSWVTRSKEDGVVTGEETLGPSPEGLRAITTAHGLCAELAKFIPLKAISEEGKQRAIAVMQERFFRLASILGPSRRRIRKP